MSELPKITVALVEDDARIRRVLVEIFSSSHDCECVGIFDDGTKASVSLPELCPAVIVMDINLAEMSGVECVRLISPKLPDTKILMLTVFQDTETIFQAMAAGAHGYLVKPVMPDELLEAVRTIRQGGVPMSPPIARRIIESFLRPKPEPTPKVTPATELDLSPREKQVLEYVVNGLSQKEIAAELSISVSSVNTYTQRIYERLHVRGRRGLIALVKGDSSR